MSDTQVIDLCPELKELLPPHFYERLIKLLAIPGALEIAAKLAQQKLQDREEARNNLIDDEKVQNF